MNRAEADRVVELAKTWLAAVVEREDYVRGEGWDQDEAKRVAARVAIAIAREVGELPDRTSPDDNADMMLVTPDELVAIAQDRIATALTAAHQDALREAAKVAERFADSNTRIRFLEDHRISKHTIGLLDSSAETATLIAAAILALASQDAAPIDWNAPPTAELRKAYEFYLAHKPATDTESDDE